MGMAVDEAGRYNMAFGIDRLFGPLALEIADGRDDTVGDATDSMAAGCVPVGPPEIGLDMTAELAAPAAVAGVKTRDARPAT